VFVVEFDEGTPVIEDLFSFHEVNVMRSKVLFSLDPIPLEFHFSVQYA